MKVLILVLGMMVGAGCNPDKNASEKTCLDNEVLRNDACIQTCESDENCSDSICHNGYCEEATRPGLSEMSPLDGALEVSVTSTVELTFSEPMAEAALNDIQLL